MGLNSNQTVGDRSLVHCKDVGFRLVQSRWRGTEFWKSNQGVLGVPFGLRNGITCFGKVGDGMGKMVHRIRHRLSFYKNGKGFLWYSRV